MIQLELDNYLCTGAAGFIGSHLVEEILKQGKQVIGIDNLVAGKKENMSGFMNDPNFTFIKEDIVRIDKIAKYFEGIDIVFHEAASKCTVCRDNPHRDLETNAYGTLNICELAYKNNAKLIHASTGSVNNGDPKSFYGISKLAAENYLKVFKECYPDFNYSILRYYHVWGTRQDSSEKGGVIPIFIKKILNNESIPIHGTGQQIRHFTNVLDVVNANFFMANLIRPNGDTYDVVSDVSITINELASKLFNMMNRESDYVYKPRRLGDIDKFDCSNEKLKSLGFEFEVDFEKGLRELIWYYDPLGATLV